MNDNESEHKQDDPMYPSQNPDFLSFNLASTPLPNRNSNDRKSNDYMNHKSNRTPYNNLSGGKYRNQYQQNNSYFQNRSSDRQFRPRKFINFQQNDNADHSNNSNRYSARSSFGRFNNQNNFRYRGGGNQSQNNKNVDISQYFHFTMLEDPWKDLVERHIALSRSLTDNQDDENLDEFHIEKSSKSSSDEDDE